MIAFKKFGRFCMPVLVLSFCALAALVRTASAIGSTTVTFQELDKGATSHFVDNFPKTTLDQGVASFSPGDMLLLTNPLAMQGKVVGKIRVACTATSAGNTEKPAGAGFNCSAIARIPGGSLVLVAELGEGIVEGAVTGGTGAYAGATGTFVSRKGKASSTTTVTLLE